MQATNKELANCIRALTIDAVEKANSGHPGMPLGMADVATILFKDFLKFSSSNPTWPDRDRFVLSAGHGSMLIYSLLYLTGFEDINLDDIKNFRQLGSKTAGHPEHEELDAIETTTGPLGQGVANAVGMAFAEKMLENRFPDLVNHYTYCIAGDGCLMEGISQEAISFASHHNLNKLILLFDDNNISIDGEVSLSSSENQVARFKACGWNVISIDGHDFDQISESLIEAKKSERPTMIACKTNIGHGSPNKQNSASSHGSPLGAEEAKLTKKNLGWKSNPFEIPQELLGFWNQIGQQGGQDYKNWQEKLNNSKNKQKFEKLINNDLGTSYKKALQSYKETLMKDKPNWASRKSSGNALEVLTKEIPQLIGGSADLTGSVNTKTSSTNPITPEDFSGRYIHYGIREHAMSGIMNGMALHKGFIPYAGTFLVFSDYCKPGIRLSSLMKQQVIYIMTHDSIGLGEDGPTHQPIEHLESMRAIPGLLVFRPCDALETAEALEIAIETKDQPSLLSLSRQNLDFVSNRDVEENLVKKGGYIISPERGDLSGIFIATGSEVAVAIEAQKKLAAENIFVRVVSMPCLEIFETQPESYKNEILNLSRDKIIAIEAAYSPVFYKYAKTLIGMNSFGASGKAEDLFKHFAIDSKTLISKFKNL